MPQTTEQARIREFWQDRARQVRADPETTHPDIWQRWLEIERIKPLLNPSDRVLDIGCGNGYTTRQLAPLVREAVGIDYSDEMIARAQRPADGLSNPSNIRFMAQDVLTLSPEKLGQFDVALSERCLINLTSTDHQRRALRNIAAVVRPGGRFILCEGSEEGRRRVNELRESAGLAPMPPIWHNLDFDEATLLAWLAPWYDVEDHAQFGLYDFLSRVVHPLLVAPETPRYDAKINELAARLSLSRRSDFAGLSRVLFLVLRRKPTPAGDV